MKKLLFLALTLLINFQAFAQTPHVDIKKLGSDIQKVVQKVYSATVLITPYDPSKGMALPGAFSGVVIDTAGIILSAAHAVQPDQLYQINFPDGKKMFARGLGRIASNDAAMMKITDKGKWPYAEIGWTSSLKKDMPCISIAYPGTVEAKTPTVRFGYIAEVTAKNGFMRTTCLMEPGDSGGPVFDMKGRVIGLHSRVELSLDENYEVPIDIYRRYWTALVDPQTYASLPAENSFTVNNNSKDLNVIPDIEQLSLSIKKGFNDQIAAASVRIKSPYKGRGIPVNILGTLIKTDGLLDEERWKGKSFVISKSSMISNVVSVEIGKEHFVPARVIARDIANDLVLLQLDQLANGGVSLTNISTNPIRFTDLGKPLLSPRVDENPVLSVLGNTRINIAKIPSGAYIGLNAASKDGKVIVASLLPGAPASRAKIAIGDTLLTINGKPLHTEDDLREEIESYTSNDTVNLACLRNGIQFEKRVAVKINSPGMELHVAYRFQDGKSERYSGFNNVIIHDGRLKPAECGGPLFGIDGTFYGINIARFSRTSSLAISAEVVSQFVKDGILKLTNIQIDN